MEIISVIMPYHKKRHYVKESVKSILDQTYKNFEILIIYDDEDKSDLNYIKDIENLDRRISLIVNDKKIGAGFSRNLGIEKSKGSFIAFLDCDDVWHKNKLEFQLKFMLEKKLAITHTSYSIIDKNNSVVGKREAKTNLDYDLLLKSCDIGLSTVMMKKNLFNNNNRFPNTITKEDYIFWLRLTKSGYKIKSLNLNLTNWRKLKNSLSSSVIQKLFDGFLVYYKYMNFNFITSFFCLIRLSIYSLFK